eukprot:scaffold77621_cov65-Phaeocystis_antarctica.AAC.2
MPNFCAVAGCWTCGWTWTSTCRWTCTCTCHYTSRDGFPAFSPRAKVDGNQAPRAERSSATRRKPSAPSSARRGHVGRSPSFRSPRHGLRASPSGPD